MGKPIDLKKHQLLMLNIMSEFASFCDEHNLNYYLDAGTLLGAVRHHGFIPWDNDADLCMTKPDFDKFIELMENKDYKLNDHLVVEKPENSIHTFYKICDTRTKLVEYPDGITPFEYHVYIDLFVKVGLPNNDKKAKKVCNKSERLGLWHWFYKRTIYKWANSNNVFKRLIGKFEITFVKNKNKAYQKQKRFINLINIKYPFNSCEYVTTLTNGEYYRRCKRKYFDDFVIMDFENKKFKCPIGYVEWLRVLYGDNYMNIPPKEKRIVHNTIVEWRDNG